MLSWITFKKGIGSNERLVWKGVTCAFIFMLTYIVLTSVYLALDETGGLIWYVTTSPSSDVSRFTKLSHLNFPCLGSNKGQSEDLFCLYKKDLLPNYKNPCWRDEEGSIRCLPYFHLIGSDKCGSTDLFNRITHHPDVETCQCVIGKESWYWSWTRYGIQHKDFHYHRRNSFLNYINMFDVSAKKIQKYTVKGYHPKVVGDGTPMDFWDLRGWVRIPQNSGLNEPLVLTPHLMRHVYGNKKFILIFRNPVDRLYSDYFFLQYGNTTESFHRDAIASINMMNECFKNMSRRNCFFNADMYTKLPLLMNGTVKTDNATCSILPDSSGWIHNPSTSILLALSGFYLFPQIKTVLRGRSFESDDGINAAVEDFWGSGDKVWWHMLEQSWVKCVGFSFEYAEK